MKLYRVFLIALLTGTFAVLGCGDDSPDNWNELDQELGGVTTNGCDGTSAAYTDLRGQASVTITAGRSLIGRQLVGPNPSATRTPLAQPLSVSSSPAEIAMPLGSSGPGRHKK